LVLGYSGSDFFDVDVAVAGLTSEALRELHVVSVAAPADLRQAASFKLYRELGLYDEVAAMMDRDALRRVPAVDRWRATSELLWEQGRWDTQIPRYLALRNTLRHWYLQAVPELLSLAAGRLEHQDGKTTP
jgi:hypothetical protein